MKSIEEIDRRLKEVEAEPVNFHNRVMMEYLQVSKDAHEEYWLRHLLRKYSYEVNEDSVIVDTLKWVLEIDGDEI